jgi:hypothetical protein
VYQPDEYTAVPLAFAHAAADESTVVNFWPLLLFVQLGFTSHWHTVSTVVLPGRESTIPFPTSLHTV